MRISIVAGDGVLHRFGNQIGALGEGQAHKALSRAINRTVDTVHGRVIRSLVKQTSAPRALVASQVSKRQVKPGGGDALEGRITATGRELSLKFFKPRQYSFGVRAKVWGRMQRFEGSFMGPRPGTVASALGGHVFVRSGEDRLPIEKMFGPSIPKEMLLAETKKTFEDTVAEMLPRRVEHEISRLLPS